MVATIAQTISKKAYTMATTGATVATRLLGKAMTALPIVAIIAGIVGIVAVIRNLISANDEATRAQRMLNEVKKTAQENSASELASLTAIGAELRSAIGDKERMNIAVGKWNETFGKDYNTSLNATTLNLQTLAAALEQVRLGIMAKSLAAAAESKLTELIKDNTDEYIKYLHVQSEVADMRAKQAEYINSGDWEKDQKKVAELRLKSLQDAKAFSDTLPNYTQAINDIYASNDIDINFAGEVDKLVYLATYIPPATKIIVDAVKEVDETVEKLYDAADEILDKPEYDPYPVVPIFGSKKNIDEGVDYALEQAAFLREQQEKISNGWYVSEIQKREKHTSDQLRLLKEYRDKGLITEKDYNVELLKIYTETFNDITAKIMPVWDSWLQYKSAQDDAQIQLYEQQQSAEMEILDQRLADAIISQTDYNAQKEQLELEYAKKKNAIQVEEAKRQKVFGAFQVGIDTAKAVMNIWADPTLTLIPKLLFSAFAAATGAFQLAAINAQPLPAYKDGRDGGAAEWAITGEQGREAVVTENGIFFTPATPTLTYLPENASVLTAPETVKLMSSGFTQTSTEDITSKKLDGIIDAIKAKEFLRINITEKGLSMSAMKGQNITRYINRNIFK
jgi:hypothetical protein